MTGQALIDALGNVAVELDEENFAANARTVREAAIEIERLRSLVTKTRAAADAATQERADLAVAEIDRLTERLQTSEIEVDRLTVALATEAEAHALVQRRDRERYEERLQTAEKTAHEWRERCEGMWSKEDVREAFREHAREMGHAIDFAKGVDPEAWLASFEEQIEAIEAGA